MIAQTLRRLEKVFPISERSVSPEQWDAQLGAFGEELSLIADRLLSVAKLSVPGRVFAESKLELLSSRNPAIVVSEFRLRPRSSYYQKLRRPIPTPENPRGPDATGLEVTLALCRGYPTRTAIRRPWLSIEFSVWGERERNCFYDLLVEHKRLVELLVCAARPSFSTACVFENVDRAKRAPAHAKLLLYYQNEDEECSFKLEREFGASATEADLIQTLLPLLALYDSALGYCASRRFRDRILDYVSLVHSEI